MQFLKNSKIEQPYEASIPLMGTYLQNPVSYHGNIYIAMLSLLHLLQQRNGTSLHVHQQENGEVKCGKYDIMEDPNSKLNMYCPSYVDPTL